MSPSPVPVHPGRATNVASEAAKGPLDDLIDKSEVVICTGSGGVGKTTTAAVLAMEAAIRGRRAVVVTIDPARRLPQVFYNFGHGHIGLTLGAITGQLLAEQASGLAPSVPLEPFLARRFAG